MKIIILTTQTTHHTKFVMDIIAKYPNTKIIQENEQIKAKFDTYHNFQSQQEIYEREIFFGGCEKNYKYCFNVRGKFYK